MDAAKPSAGAIVARSSAPHGSVIRISSKQPARSSGIEVASPRRKRALGRPPLRAGRAMSRDASRIPCASVSRPTASVPSSHRAARTTA